MVWFLFLDNLYGWYTYKYIHAQPHSMYPRMREPHGALPHRPGYIRRHGMEATANRAISVRVGLMFVPFLGETELHTGIHHDKFKNAIY